MYLTNRRYILDIVQGIKDIQNLGYMSSKIEVLLQDEGIESFIAF